ncbi:hypothetical protein [Paenibacillus sp. LK1]|uniref:hypothetical protein n=1 Tax=Paenibacillus sp. LK1 TaxID=2053014 RepID=UPI000C1A2092|nr:hypothetical protein [Paenibacillus sp. LK1]PIH61092.1 hypothetical protein CS562_01325 [Paenibacillus sp. LK1]
MSVMSFEELERKSCKQLVERIKELSNGGFQSFSNIHAIEVVHDYTFEETGARDQVVCVAFNHTGASYNLRYDNGEFVSLKENILITEEIKFFSKHIL